MNCARPATTGAGLHLERRAPVRAAAGRQRHHGARHAVAGDLRHRGGARVRHRRRDRRDGRLRAVAGLRADVDGPGAPAAVLAAAGAMADRPAAGRRAASRFAVPAPCWPPSPSSRRWPSAASTRLRVDTNHINFFADTHPLHQSAVLIDDQLAGIYSFQVMLEGPADSLKSPDALARIERLERELQTLPSVKKVIEPRRLHQAREPRSCTTIDQRRRSSRRRPRPSRRSCSSLACQMTGASNWSGSSRATSRGRRSP